MVDDATHVPTTSLTDALDVPVLFIIKAFSLVKNIARQKSFMNDFKRSLR